jgi:ubiquinone/menaquinone biosynthesis C-methylase UbiE
MSKEDMKVKGQWREPDVVEWYDLNQGKEGDTFNKELIAPAVFELLGDISGEDVLDSGCGSGYFTAELAQKIGTGKIVGTDFPEAVELCKRKYSSIPNMSFAAHDVAMAMPFQEGSFDKVVSKMVLQYVEVMNTFAHESHRVLNEGGDLVLAVDHPFHTQFYYAQQAAGKPNPKYSGLNDYFNHDPQTKVSLWGKVPLTWYPRTMSDYMLPFVQAGYTLTGMKEVPEEQNGVKVPRILALKFRKQSALSNK